MCEGTWTTLEPGGYMNIPRGSVHSFRNDGAEEVRVITGFEPQDFERLFLEFGVAADAPAAFEDSVSEAAIGQVVERCGEFGMVIAPT